MGNLAREYIQRLRQRNREVLGRGEQIDFYDTIATSRPTGEQAVYWLLPALREAQSDRGELLVACRAAYNALRSYQYGNGSPDLAKTIADKLHDLLDELGLEVS